MKKAIILFYASLLCVCLLGLSFLVMKPVTLSENNTIITALGIVFWLLFALSIAMGLLSAKSAKEYVQAETWESMQPGIVSPFKSETGKAADVVFVVSLILTIIGVNTQLRYSYVIYIFLLLLTVSFGMHCLFNGKVYRSLIENIKQPKQAEAEKIKKMVKIKSKKDKYNGKHL